MLGAMDQVRQSVQKAYHWISWEEYIFLCMDNAGGHGTKEMIARYTEILKRVYNIIVVHQVLRLSFTNLFNLGL